MSSPVKLYVYDLSQGLAKQLSPQFIGVEIEAVYHTSIVVHNKEWFFGQGIGFSEPGKTHHGTPMEVVDLGETEVDEDVLMDYLNDLKDEYHAGSYDLFRHNCNNFSNDVAEFLTGNSIPEKIRKLPETVLSTPMGQMLGQMLSQQFSGMATTMGVNEQAI